MCHSPRGDDDYPETLTSSSMTMFRQICKERGRRKERLTIVCLIIEVRVGGGGGEISRIRDENRKLKLNIRQIESPESGQNLCNIT